MASTVKVERPTETPRAAPLSIADNLDRLSKEILPRIVIERISLNHVDPAIPKLLTKETRKSPVFLQQSCRHVAARYFLRQRAQSGTNLDHMIPRHQLQAIHNPGSEIFVVQEILAQ